MCARMVGRMDGEERLGRVMDVPHEAMETVHGSRIRWHRAENVMDVPHEAKTARRGAARAENGPREAKNRAETGNGPRQAQDAGENEQVGLSQGH